MKLLKKIMVATDFSQPPRDTLRMGVLLAKEFHSEMVLIHVIPEIRGLKIDRDEIRRIGTPYYTAAGPVFIKNKSCWASPLNPKKKSC